MSLEDGLNREQLLAMKHDQGPALIIAGAGTGKTTVITRRIVWLVESEKARIDEILALTFTEKAASEMEARVDLLMPTKAFEPNIKTFHGLGESILRDYAFELGLSSDFKIMSNFAQALFIEELISQMDLEYYAPLGNPYSFVSAIIKHFGRLKDEAITPSTYTTYAKDKLKQASTEEELAAANRTAELAKIYQRYCEEAIARGWVDFGDLIGMVHELFVTKPHILKQVSERFKYILVDEFQDTNTIQAKLVSLLSKKHHNVQVVGDDDQSIYRFRGASVSNIMNFMDQYPNAKQIVLKQNYRSTQQILDAAYRLIKHNDPDRLESKYKIDKQLLSSQSGEVPYQHEFVSLPEENKFVATKIASLISSGVSPNQIAILIRNNNQADKIRPALERKSVPYHQIQGMKLLERPEIKAIINFVAVINKPTDNRALYGLLTGDISRIPVAEVVEMTSHADKAHTPLIDALIQDDMGKKFIHIIDLLERMRTISNEMTASQLIFEYLSESGYLNRLKEEADLDPQAGLKLQNLSKLISIIKEFESATLDPNIYSFWRHIDEISTTESVDVAAEESPLDSNAVTIMTIHRAKGLEFEHVFMIDLAQQTFPSKNQANILPLDDELLKIQHPKDWHLAEERRLFYVGMTRAKHRLYLTNSVDHGGKRLKKMSKFVFEAIKNPQTVPPNSDTAAAAHLDSLARPTKQPKVNLVNALYQNDWLHLSPNQIASYLYSPKEFYYNEVLLLPRKPVHSLVYGTAIHQVIEYYYKTKLAGESVELSNLYDIFEKSWSSEGFISLPHEQKRFDRGKKVIKAFFYREEKNIDLPKYVERAFSLSIPELKLRINGRIDALYEREGRVEIRDFKTGHVEDRVKAENKLKGNIQLDIYAMAWERNTASPVDQKSLYFVEPDILVQTDIIDHQKTLAKLKKVVDGIANHEFDTAGGSRVKFGKLL